MIKINYKTILLILFITIIVSLYSYNQTILYKKHLTNQINIVVNKLIYNHPELEQEIISSISSDSKNNINILEKYGINENTIIELNEIQILTRNIIITNCIFTLIIILLILYINNNKYKKQKQYNNTIEKYITNILNNNFNFNFADYDETDQSINLNNIYKLTTKLKTERDLYYKDKVALETYLSDISHQLKTPLTSLLLINDALLNPNISELKRKEFILKSNKELQKIEWLIISLLKLAKMESKTIKFKKEKCNLLKMLNEIEETFSINFEIKNQQVKINCNKNITVINDYNWLKEAISNVIKNANEYGLANTIIKITIKDNPIYTNIDIENTSKSIDDMDVKNVFNRFYKGKNSSSSSVGIGLNLTKNILEHNHGTISISTSNNETKFSIKLFKNIK